MAGNVAEWVADVYRPIIDDEFNDFNYFRGNIFLKNAIDQDGKASIVSPDQLVFDTLPDGKIMLKKLPGSLEETAITEEETFLRQNFSKSNNINFRDGDPQSTRLYENTESVESSGEPETNVMYNAPIPPKVPIGDDGKIVWDEIEIDKSNRRTTLINDEVRVFKGGSWRDRAYWLDPAQRRYLPQYIATDYIGFRLAMSRLGEKGKIKKTARHKRQK